MRYNTAMLPKKEIISSSFRGEGSKNTIKNKRIPPKKPSYLSKRSVSLPTDLHNITVKSRKLFWFIPRDVRHQQRSYRCDNGCPESESSRETPGSNAEKQIGNGRMIREWQLPSCQEIPETAALEWITTSSMHSLSDSTTSEESDESYYDDDHDGPLLGLEFVECLTEINIEK